jgi:hypothetical protein
MQELAQSLGAIVSLATLRAGHVLLGACVDWGG